MHFTESVGEFGPALFLWAGPTLLHFARPLLGDDGVVRNALCFSQLQRWPPQLSQYGFRTHVAGSTIRPIIATISSQDYAISKALGRATRGSAASPDFQIPHH
jgi:hypothetical protein